MHEVRRPQVSSIHANDYLHTILYIKDILFSRKTLLVFTLYKLDTVCHVIERKQEVYDLTKVEFLSKPNINITLAYFLRLQRPNVTLNDKENIFEYIFLNI